MFIEVFCKSEDNFTLAELIAMIEQGKFFDPPAQYNIPPGDPEMDDDGWPYFEITYHPEKRPIQITRNVGQKECREQIDETIEHIIDRHGESAYPELIEHFRATRQIIAIEIGWKLWKSGYKAIDLLESAWCEKLDGYVYVGAEGIYDRHLRVVCNLSSAPWRDLALIDPHVERDKKELASKDVFCGSDEVYPPQMIREMMEYTCGMDDLQFIPPLDELDAKGWKQFEIDHADSGEKISVYRYAKGDGEFEIVLAESLKLQKGWFKLLAHDFETPMRQSRQIYSLVYHRPTIDDDIDLGIYNSSFDIAERLDGVISTYEGFYDKEKHFHDGRGDD